MVTGLRQYCSLPSPSYVQWFECPHQNTCWKLSIQDHVLVTFGVVIRTSGFWAHNGLVDQWFVERGYNFVINVSSLISPISPCDGTLARTPLPSAKARLLDYPASSTEPRRLLFLVKCPVYGTKTCKETQGEAWMEASPASKI